MFDKLATYKTEDLHSTDLRGTFDQLIDDNINLFIMLKFY